MKCFGAIKYIKSQKISIFASGHINYNREMNTKTMQLMRPKTHQKAKMSKQHSSEQRD